MNRAACTLCVFAALTLAACGRGGSPQTPAPPPGVTMVPVDPNDPQEAEAPDRRFVLDPILQ